MDGRVRVFALGGSILSPAGPDVAYARAFADVVAERLALGERSLIVTGGGRPARQYIAAGRAFGVPEDDLDRIGIEATRLNARFLAAALRQVCGPAVATEVPHETASTAALLLDHRVAVMGGTTPGHSTDLVAAELASLVPGADLVVLTNVNGVYTSDPKVDQAAERLPELTSSRLVAIAGHGEWTAGRAGIVDPPCAHLIHRARLPTTVFDGRRIDELRRLLGGDEAIGSRVIPDA